MLRNVCRLFVNKNNKCVSKLLKFKCSVLQPASERALHVSPILHDKIFIDRENNYCYNIIKSYENIKPAANTIHKKKQILTEEDFNTFLNKTWRSSAAADIVSAFRDVVTVCNLNNIAISDHRFDPLVDGLMDNVEKLSDDELGELLDILAEFPPCESFKSHNIHDVWSALDDVCCWRMPNWDTDKLLMMADKWYELNLAKVVDYIHEVIDKLSRKPSRLTAKQLVHVFFYFNVRRKKTIDFEYEVAVEQKVAEMDLNQIAVVCLGYFKSQSKVKIPHVLSMMMRKVMEVDADKIHEMTLCAILKQIRHTSNPLLSDQMFDLMQHLTPQHSRLSTLCLLHSALLGTTLQIKHEPSIKSAAERIAKNAHDVEKVRMKELERVLLPMTMFSYDPKTTPDAYSTIMQELHEERRQKEFAQHPRCLASALHFLSIHGKYSYELMNKILDKEFLLETYGNSGPSLPREVFSLDTSIDIECPDYKGNRMLPQKRYKAAKWLSTYTPTHDQRKRLSASDKLVLDVIDCVKAITKDNMLVEHLLPHFDRADIVICRDKSGVFVKPTGLEKYTLGDVMRPTDDKLEWYALVVVGWNVTIRNTSEPVGYIKMKFRQLQKIGYKPIPIIWNQYLPLTAADKRKYICKQL